MRRLLTMLVTTSLVLVLAACGRQQSSGAAHGAASGAEHGATHAADAPYDAQFIDGMTIHHQGAVSMAEQALRESQRTEITRFAQNIIATQSAEIAQIADWRSRWYPDLAPTGGTGAHMGDMELSSDTSIPFDQRFITAMIDHHNGAIAMGRRR